MAKIEDRGEEMGVKLVNEKGEKFNRNAFLGDQFTRATLHMSRYYGASFPLAGDELKLACRLLNNYIYKLRNGYEIMMILYAIGNIEEVGSPVLSQDSVDFLQEFLDFLERSEAVARADGEDGAGFDHVKTEPTDWIDPRVSK